MVEDRGCFAQTALNGGERAAGTDWSGKKVVIIGAARQGLALAHYLSGRGARVTLNDRRPAAELGREHHEWESQRVEWVCGGHPLELLDGADLVCPSGGVPLDLPLVVEARRRGIRLSNDSQIFLEAAPCRVVGITGSAGKTTTTTLVGRMAAALHEGHEQGEIRASIRSYVGGNIGNPLISALDEIQPGDLAFMELSSFQLELMTCSPDVAAILNITPNHLDRHGTMEAYTAAKARILAYQSPDGVAVLGRDDPGAWALAGRCRGQMLSFGLSILPLDQAGTFIAGGPSSPPSFREGPEVGRDEPALGKNEVEAAIYLRAEPGGVDQKVIECSRIELRGQHNLLNVAAACAIAAAAGLPMQAIRDGIQGFRGVPHRLELVGEWGGAAWYNDSIATAPERAIAAIRSFEEPLILLAGGRDKNLPWEEFADLVRRRVDHLVVFGEAAPIILQALDLGGADQPRPLLEGSTYPQPLPEGRGEEGRLTVTRCQGLQQAVQAAARLVRPGDVVLLAPGGTSFDEFRDFEERGACFAQWVKELP